MKSVGRWKASKLRFLGVLVLVLGVGNGLSESANAGGCDESEEPCIEVVEDRIVIRDNHAIRSILEAERERMHQEALMAELERKRQMEAENDDEREEDELTDAQKALLCQLASDRLSDANATVALGVAVTVTGSVLAASSSVTGVGALAGASIAIGGLGITVTGEVRKSLAWNQMQEFCPQLPSS